MAVIALHSASTGLKALSTQLDVIANNIANSNTDGFKASRTNFQDLLYLEKAQPGTENVNGDQRPTGLYVGLGVKVAGTEISFQQGSPHPTGEPFDIMIEGDGFFPVLIEDDRGEGIAYTRYGAFTPNRDGDLVLTTSEGRRLDPPINIPIGSSLPSISADGTVSVLTPGSTEPTIVGNIEIATFVNPRGLKQIGENLFLPTAASGDAVQGAPFEADRGGILQGFLESSNVDPVKELVDLIRTQRGFEFNSQSIQAADEALQTIGRLRRF